MSAEAYGYERLCGYPPVWLLFLPPIEPLSDCIGCQSLFDPDSLLQKETFQAVMLLCTSLYLLSDVPIVVHIGLFYFCPEPHEAASGQNPNDPILCSEL